jgi:hypothetical protein
VSSGTMVENARIRYRVRSVHAPRGIPVPRTSQLLTNPILAARAGRLADRRISAGFIVEAATGAPDSHSSRLAKRRTTRTLSSACLKIIQSYQRMALCCGASMIDAIAGEGRKTEWCALAGRPRSLPYSRGQHQRLLCRRGLLEQPERPLASKHLDLVLDVFDAAQVMEDRSQVFRRRLPHITWYHQYASSMSFQRAFT